MATKKIVGMMHVKELEIKYSHVYTKFPSEWVNATVILQKTPVSRPHLLGRAQLANVTKTKFEDLSEVARQRDTEYVERLEDGTLKHGHYPLPKKGDCLVLSFQINAPHQDGWLIAAFSTIRPWKPWKAEYYANNVGNTFNHVLIEEIKRKP